MPTKRVWAIIVWIWLLYALCILSGCCNSPKHELIHVYRDGYGYTLWVWACPFCGKDYEREVEAKVCINSHSE